ncbi:cadmium-translocating P-type ATPase [Verrucomicrobiaceae bacterium N1E253]|uniref:Cadmium-translocating P-type ATPase n=1 Tax=Oceaniferula marina TaxID=2748318 RepID=A0A851GEI2_9BACT|nr:cation-translocating P-type ATPase [Oceaniferula marina]NWK55589.1 cadmium-translocating P-type ATPase [Oceaniferula marina]
MPDAGIMLEKDFCPTAPKFWRCNDISGIQIKPRQTVLNPNREHSHGIEDHDHHGHHHGHHHHHHDWKPQLLSAVICGVLGVAAWVIGSQATPDRHILSIVLFMASFIAGAWFPAQEVWELLRKRIVDIHFLMLAVGIGAASIGHWGEGAVLLFLFSLSGAMEALAMARTEREIQGLFKEAPKQATRIDLEGQESAIDVDKIATGTLLRVRPGEQFPVDAKVISGSSSADESTLTGESIPVDKSLGDKVFSGTINTWGMIDCTAIRPANESALAKIIKLIRDAQESKAPSQRFTDKFGTGYTYAVLAASTLMFLIWHFGFGLPAFISTESTSSAFYRAMTLLVVASPCALVLSIPSAILAGIAAGARGGVLFRGGIAIEELAEIDHVAMDKTGTLTSGELEIVTVESFPPGNEQEVLNIAATLAHQSTHPLSRAITRHWKEQFPQKELTSSSGFRSLTGMGIEGHINGQHLSLGRRDLFIESWENMPELPSIGITETLVGNQQIRGRILLRDQIRPQSADLLTKLDQAGLKVTMLTGDRKESARKVADEIHLRDFLAELHPEDKVAAIRSWRDQGERVAMIGDGVNDAPSLAAADVAVGMGMRGSDAVLEQADVILMQDRLENFHYAYTLSRKARSIIHQNLVISLGVILVLVLGALGSFLPLTLGVIGHEGSTVVVVLNSLRLLFHRKVEAPASTKRLAL